MQEINAVTSPSGYEWWEAWLGLFLLLLLGAAAALGGAAALLSVPALLDGVGERQTLAGAWIEGRNDTR